MMSPFLIAWYVTHCTSCLCVVSSNSGSALGFYPWLDREVVLGSAKMHRLIGRQRQDGLPDSGWVEVDGVRVSSMNGLPLKTTCVTKALPSCHGWAGILQRGKVRRLCESRHDGLVAVMDGFMSKAEPSYTLGVSAIY